MSAKGLSISLSSTFDGWYVNHEGTRKKLLNTDGSIYTGAGDIAGITQDGIFNVNLDAYPEGDIELYAMWKISYNPLIFVTDLDYSLINSTRQYLIIAQVPREEEEGTKTEFYCMTGDQSLSLFKEVSATQVDLHHLHGDYYFLASPVDENPNLTTMLWDITRDNQKYLYLPIGNPSSYSYIGQRATDNCVVFRRQKDAVKHTAYRSDKHNLHFTGNDRILFEEGKFIFESSNQDTIKTQDGGIWLFEYSTTTAESLHEFK